MVRDMHVVAASYHYLSSPLQSFTFLLHMDNNILYN